MNCSGPCLPHCYKCSTTTVYISKIAITYFLGILLYNLLKKNYDHEFMNTLNCEQKNAYNKSKNKNFKLFLFYIILSSFITRNIKFNPI